MIKINKKITESKGKSNDVGVHSNDGNDCKDSSGILTKKSRKLGLKPSPLHTNRRRLQRDY